MSCRGRCEERAEATAANGHKVYARKDSAYACVSRRLSTSARSRARAHEDSDVLVPAYDNTGLSMHVVNDDRADISIRRSQVQNAYPR
eukprot:2229744-Pleurochrysis_carterae.AAC.1